MKRMLLYFFEGMVVGYLERCGFSFRVNIPGKWGKRVVMMTENQYRDFRQSIPWPAERP